MPRPTRDRVGAVLERGDLEKDLAKRGFRAPPLRLRSIPKRLVFWVKICVAPLALKYFVLELDPFTGLGEGERES